MASDLTVRDLIDLLLNEEMGAIVTVGVGESDLSLTGNLYRDQYRRSWVQLQVREEATNAE